MNNTWQLCVIDTDIIDFSSIDRIDESERLNVTIKDYGKLNNGRIVFVINTFFKQFNEIPAANIDSLYECLRFLPVYSFLGGIVFAYVFDPRKNEYGVLLNDVLRPIITFEDAIQAELKFGIDLKHYVN